MAISGSDGSIILTTSVDTSGISKGSVSIKSALQGVNASVEKVKNSFSAFREQKASLATLTQAMKDQQFVIKSLSTEYAKLVAAGKGNSQQAKKLKTDIDSLTVEMKEMQGAATTLGAKGTTALGRIGTAMKTLLSYFIGIQTVFKVINFSSEAAKFATETEASTQRLVDIYGSAAQSVGDFIDQNAMAIGMSKSAGASIASTYGNLLSVWADQETNAKLTNSLLNQTAVVASKTGRTTEDVAERIRSGLLGNTEAIEDLGINVNIKTIEITNAFKRIADGRSWEQLNAYEQSQVRTMAILEQSTNKYGNSVANTTATIRNQYQAAYEDFKNTWGQVINAVLIPVLNVMAQIFTIMTKGLQMIMGSTGKTVDITKSQEKSIGGVVQSQNDLTKAVKETNKEQKKSLAGFDQLNVLSKEASNSGGGNSGGGPSALPFDTNPPPPDGGDDTSKKVNAKLAAIMGIVGAALVAIGIILICFRHVGWGIGFIIAGAYLYGVSQAALSEGGETEKIKNIMNGIIAGISLLALVLGIIIVATSKTHLALGIGLIVAGAVGLATEIAVNWDAITETLTKFFTDNAGIIAGLSAALLVIGILLCVAQLWGPGIGLIVAGVAGIATVVVVNWEAIKTTVIDMFNSVVNWIKTYGLLVLGIILCLTGIGIPIGIALIVKWAINGAEEGVPLATAIVDKVKEIWKNIKDFWKKNIAPIFTAEWWKKLGKKALNGLIGVFEDFLNFITMGFRGLVNTAVSIINEIGDVLGLDWNLPKIKKIKLPRLAQGAVVPPNREFMAILGDNKKETEVVSPLSTMKQAFLEALQVSGAVNVAQDNRPIILQIDGREIARVTREGNAKLGSQTVFGGFANAY